MSTGGHFIGVNPVRPAGAKQEIGSVLLVTTCPAGWSTKCLQPAGCHRLHRLNLGLARFHSLLNDGAPMESIDGQAAGSFVDTQVRQDCRFVHCGFLATSSSQKEHKFVAYSVFVMPDWQIKLNGVNSILGRAVVVHVGSTTDRQAQWSAAAYSFGFDLDLISWWLLRACA